jgi:hypothetical protein
MTVEEIRACIDVAVTRGYLFEQGGTMLSTAEGYNQAALAVLGAMLLNLGKPTFNMYCESQSRALGWLQSKANPISRQARELRTKFRQQDPSMQSMFEDATKAFIAPLLSAHARAGGRPIARDHEEATCAMLLAKIIWDYKFGNPLLAPSIRMLGVSV